MKITAKLLVIIVLIVSFFQFKVYCSSPSFTSDVASVILIDNATGAVLHEENSEKIVYPASTTKIMNAIVAIENAELETVMTASSQAVHNIGIDGMHVGISPGEQLTFNDLLHAMLVKSANDAANIIAENIAGSIDAFVELMNKKAKELGALNTNFKNAHGCHDPEHYTTANDMAKIARYAMSIPKFREVVLTTCYVIPPTNICSKPKEIYSSNKLYYEHTTGPTVFYPYATGIKTGFTSEAGYNFVGAARKDYIELISVVMGCTKNGLTNEVFKITKDILDYGFSNFSMQQIVKPNSLFSTVAVKNSKAGALLNINTAEGVTALMPNNKDDWNIKITPYINPDLHAPVKKGDVVGYAEYCKYNTVTDKINLIADNDVDWSLNSYIYSSINNCRYPFLSKALIAVIILLTLHLIIIRPVIRRICKYCIYKSR